MIVNLSVRTFLKTKKYASDFFRKIIRSAGLITGLQAETVGLAIHLVDEKKIQTLNRDYRGQDRPTDVLAFGLGKTLVGGILELGDIFICYPLAQAEARTEGVRLQDKLAALAVHGYLHLLGYDHERSAAAKNQMFALQNKILNSLNR